MMSFARFAVERVLNSLPEGLLIALCAWLLLRLMGRQNSGTRFAVWLVALAGVAAVPFLTGFDSGHQGFPALIPHAHPEIAVPAFWAVAFFILWIGVATVALARVIAGILQVRQIRRSCAEIPAADLDPTLRELIAETKRPVRLLASEKVRVPAALGFRNPAVVLPAWALRDLTADQLRPIVIHELAHLRRHDDWTNLLQKAIRALLFFHPAVWWIDARLSLEREMACDDAVLAATGNPRAYAGCLIDLLERGCARRGFAMAQAAIARARDASVRIARILHVGSGATTRVGRAALGVATALSIACAGAALYTPQFVEFVPMHSTSAVQLSADDDVIIPAAAVVPASFLPAQKPSLLSKTGAKRSSPSHAAALRQVAAHKPSAPKNPYVMASFFTDDAANWNSPAPMLVVLETTDSGNGLSTSARLQTTTAAQPASSKVQQLQSREDPALQIQIVQAIDPETGTPIQVLRIVLMVPLHTGSPSQSI